MFARRWWHNRFRILPAQVIGAIEAGDVPVLLDVRTKTDFETSPLRLPGAVRVDPEALGAADFKLERRARADDRRLLHEPRGGHQRARWRRSCASAATSACASSRAASAAGPTRGCRWSPSRHLPSIGLEIYKNLTLGDLERRHFKAGEVIAKEGADANGEAYVVHSGVGRGPPRASTASTGCSAPWARAS